MRARTIVGIAGGTLALTCGAALPAFANNVDLAVGPTPTHKYHHGMWSDATDNLGACLGGAGTFYKVVVTIRPSDGTGPVFSEIDTTAGNGCEYTGNLSIPEDERYIMTLTAYNVVASKNLSDSLGFYT
ncbi:hypothetical protein [Kribbella sp. NPDC055071]